MAMAGATCPRCGGATGSGVFCTRCGTLNRFAEAEVYVASRLRRLAGNLLEGVLLLVTLGVGWLIWLAIVAPRSQTPAKALLGMYILNDDETPASAARVWLREIVIKLIIFGVIGWVTGGIVTLLDALWILWDKNRQTLHDKIATTIVVRAPQGIGQLPGGVSPGRPAPPPAQRPAPGGLGAYQARGTPEARLRELRDLADQGLITEADYERRRGRILDEM